MKKTQKQNITKSIDSLSTAKMLLIAIFVLSMIGGWILIVEDKLVPGIYVIAFSILFYFFSWILIQLWNAINIANRQIEEIIKDKPDAKQE